jgi:hypothetical protein
MAEENEDQKRSKRSDNATEDSSSTKQGERLLGNVLGMISSATRCICYVKQTRYPAAIDDGFAT